MHAYGTPLRFTRHAPFPVCHGYDALPRGEGRRCAGFLSSDGHYIHCSREELAGDLPLVEGSGTYAHRAHGPCRCGATHGQADAAEKARIVASYDYRGAGGDLLFQTVRMEPKGFRQRRPDGLGGWEWNLRGVDPVLYRLPELAAHPERAVWVVEGEKDVDALYGIGLVATCNPMGAGKWRAEYSQALGGRHVLIVPDNDLPGRRHAEAVAAALAGIAASVRIVELGGLAAGGDVSDWLAAGHTREELEDLAKACRPEGAPATAVRRVTIPTARELLAEEFPEPKMVVPGLIVEGCTLFAGSPKVGKTITMQHIAIAVTCGGYALGTLKCEQGRVAYLALEDSRRLCQKRIRQLLHGQECPERLHICNSWRRFDEGGIEDLDAWLTDHPDTRLVVVDTLQRVRPREHVTRGLYQQDYDALGPLTDLSHKHNVAIVCVHHTRKMVSDDVLDMISGTQGLAGAVDAIIVLQRARFGTDGVLSVMGRDVEEQAYAVRWDRELAQWKLEGSAEDFARSREQNAILNVLRAAKLRALSIQEIADRVGRAANSGLRMLLSRLVEAGLAISPRRGQYQAAEPPEEGTDGELSLCHSVTADDADEADEAAAIPPYNIRAFLDEVQAVPWDEDDEQAADVCASSDTSDKVTNAVPCPSCRVRYTWKPAPYNPELLICRRCGVTHPDQRDDV